MDSILDKNKDLIRLKKGGFSNAHIAAKLALTEEEVEKAWHDIQLYSIGLVHGGYNTLCDVYTNLCHQYQLLGQSLKMVSVAISDSMPPEELRALIVPNDVDSTVAALLSSAIILRPFKLPTDAELAVIETQGGVANS